MCPPDFSSLSYVLVQKRNMLRLTAKSTQFGHRTFTSWLIESAGTVPIKRKKDYPDGQVDNSNVMEKLMEVCFPSCDSFIPSSCDIRKSIHKKALELGDAVCLFPEGFSRFHPTIAPLKTGGEPFVVCFRESV